MNEWWEGTNFCFLLISARLSCVLMFGCSKIYVLYDCKHLRNRPQNHPDIYQEIDKDIFKISGVSNSTNTLDYQDLIFVQIIILSERC